MQCNCLKNVTPQRDLPRDFESTQNLDKRGNLPHFIGPSHNIPPFFSLLSKHFFPRVVYFTFNEGGSYSRGFFSAPLPPHPWLISCCLPQALADKIGIGCSLVRGEYGRAWNEVKLMNESRKGITGGFPPPEVYIVDLIFQPGGLIKLKSREADLYRFL